MAKECGGSSFLPAVVCLRACHPENRWQWWRDHRGIWGPTPFLSPDGFEVSCDRNSLTYSSSGEVIARWSDWTEAVGERLKPRIESCDRTMPACSQAVPPGVF